MAKNSILVATLFLATFLRFYRIDAQSFWNDEGNSARIAERSLPLILAGAAGDIHPPGYYLMMAAWRAVAGHSEFALRGLSALAGIVLVALVYRLGRGYFDEPAALCAAFFAAIHPALIYYSQEARMYELAAMFSAAAFLFTSRWINAIYYRTRSLARLSAGVILSIAAGLYTHYSFAFVVVALNLVVLISLLYHPLHPVRDLRNRVYKPLALWLGLQTLALVVFSPWLPIAFRQVTTWPAGREYLPPLESVIGVTRWITLGPTTAIAATVPAIGGVIVLLLLGIWRRGQLIPPLSCLLVPTAFTWVLGLFSPAFAKFLIIAVPALCLLMGNGAAGLWATNRSETIAPARALSPFSSRIVAVLSLACGGLLTLGMLVTLRDLYFNPAYARADYRGMAHYLDSIARPGDAILLNAPNQWEVFTYYHPDTSNVFPVARSRPLNVPEQIAELQQIAATHERLFVIYWGDAQTDPNRVIETWLNEHTFKAYDQWYGDVRLAAYAVPRTATAVQTPIGLTFGDQIVLEGYSLNAASFVPGDILQLTLFWRTPSPVLTRYKVFVHLVGDPGAPPAAQHDGEPGGGLALTTTWKPGETVLDNHGVFIPLDLPRGEYSLVVGLYGVEDGVRLTTVDGADSLFLSKIAVK